MNPFFTVIDKPDYNIALEFHPGIACIHSDVHRWTHKVAAAYRRDVDYACSLVAEPVYALQSADGKTPSDHFLYSFGFEPCGECANHLGETVPLWGRFNERHVKRIWQRDH